MNSKKYGFNPRLNPAVAPLAAAIGLALGASSLQAATITVTTLADGSLPGQCTLRDALVAANGDAPAAGCTPGLGADTIVFQSGLNGTITLTASMLPIVSDITINGPGPEQLTISGGGNYRVMAAIGPVTAQINGIRLANGYINDFYGGAGLLVVDSSLTLSNCEIANNTGGPNAYGGGITLSSADLTVDSCVITGNSVAGGMVPRGAATAFGGGILAVSSQASITGTNFLDNSASRYGGGLALVNSIATITTSNFNANEALIGGAISVGGGSQLSLETSSLIDNFAGGGGALTVGSMSYASVDSAELYGNNAIYFGGGALVGVGYSTPTPIAAQPRAEVPFGALNFSLIGPGEISMQNTYVAFNTTQGAGGGIGTKYGSYAELFASDFAYNVAGMSPAPRASFGPGRRGDPSAGGRGAGLAALDGSYITGLDLNIRANNAVLGGGVFTDQYASAVLETSIVSGNMAELGGGLLGGYIDPPPVPRENASTSRGTPYDGSVSVIDSLVIDNYAENGGGIASTFGGSAVVKYSDVIENTALQFGGGIFAYDASLISADSQVSNNQALYGAGILARYGSGATVITRSSISGNTATLVGGGLDLRDLTAVVKYSTVSGNSASVIGGVLLAGTPGNQPSMLNTTVTDNSATQVGGLYAIQATLDFVTISHNTASGDPAPRLETGLPTGITENPGGAYFDDGVQVSNTIFSDNVSPGDTIDLTVSGTPGGVQIEYSLIETPGLGVPAGVGNVLNVDPQLSILAANGGPTPTRAIGLGSPALDAADPVTSLSFDQRGNPFPRVFGGRADMGAFEFSIDGVFQDRFEQL